jgi:hypothetical protein
MFSQIITICKGPLHIINNYNTFIASSQLTKSNHWICYCIVHGNYVFFHFCGHVFLSSRYLLLFVIKEESVG